MFKKIFSYSIVEGLSKGLNWIMIAALPLILSPEQYGLTGLLVAIEGTLSTLMLAGQERALLRFHHEKEKNVFRYSTQLIILISILSLIIVAVISFFSKSIAGLPVFPSFFLLLISIGFYNAGRLLMTSSRAAENLKLFWGTRFFYQFVKIISVFTICFILNNASGYVYGALLSALILIMTYYKDFSKQFSIRKLFVFNPHFKFLLFFGMPLIFNALSGSILSYADRFFIQGFLNQRELGIYTFTYSLGSSLFFFFGVTLISFEPLAYKYAQEKKDFRRLLNSYSKVVPSAAFIFALLIIFFFKLYVTHLLKPAYLDGYFILPVLLSAHLLLPMYNIGTIEFIILSQPKFIAYTTIFSACINLFFNFLLIPSMGIAGAALSTFITYFMLIATIHFLLIQRKVLSLGTYKHGYLQTIFFCILIFLFAYNENLFFRIIFLIASLTYLLIHILKMKNFFKYKETDILQINRGNRK